MMMRLAPSELVFQLRAGEAELRVMRVMRRLSLFVSSSVSKRIKFLSEIEFEDGAKEISVEFASVDMEFNPLFNLRGGIVLNPIGAFNQNHDANVAGNIQQRGLWVVWKKIFGQLGVWL